MGILQVTISYAKKAEICFLCRLKDFCQFKFFFSFQKESTDEDLLLKRFLYFQDLFFFSIVE